MKLQLAKDMTLFAMAVVATAVLLSFTNRRPPAVSVAIATDYSGISNSQLLQLPLTRPVCEELLFRPELETRSVVAALRRLARLKNEQPGDTFFELLESMDDESPKPVLRNLSFAVQHVAEDLADKAGLFRDRLLATTISGQSKSIRMVAFASLISMDGSTETVFAESNVAQRCELIEALTLVNRFCVEENLYERLRPAIVDSDVDTSWKAAALAATAEMPYVHKEVATDLVNLLVQQKSTKLTDGLARLPVAALPENQLGFIASQFIARLAELSRTQDRTETKLLAQRCLEIGQRLPRGKCDRIEKRIAELTRAIE